MPERSRPETAAETATCISIVVDSLRPMLERTVVFVAHPDDEAVGCGALLQRIADPIVIFATDGAPRADYFWQNYGSRERYAEVRADEARCALSAVGVRQLYFVGRSEGIADQELHTQLDRAYHKLADILDDVQPQSILTLAYEGGHPDHDACCFLAAQAAQQFGVPAWEMTLYHRQGSEIVRQAFLDNGESVDLDVTREELLLKQDMFAVYESQAEVLREFLPYVERFRPVQAYDFSRPPHSGVLNYEAWGWPMTGSELCSAFGRFRNEISTRKQEWGTAA